MSFREIVKNEFQIRKLRNKNYSLRSYARDLKLSVSGLSLIVNGKAGLSAKKALLLARQLNLTGDEINYFVDLVISECGRSSPVRREAQLRLAGYDTRFNTMSIENIQPLLEWFAIPSIELIRIDSRNAEPKRLSLKLGISMAQAKEILSCLEEQKILTNGSVNANFIILPDGPPDEATRKFHETILTKAHGAIRTLEKSERNISSSIIRMDKKDLEWAAQEMKKFRRRLAQRLEGKDSQDSVFAISTQIFRLDREI